MRVVCMHTRLYTSNIIVMILFSHNQLTELGEVLGSLVNLQCLRVDHNQLHNLHDNISSLIHLEQLVKLWCYHSYHVGIIPY